MIKTIFFRIALIFTFALGLPGQLLADEEEARREAKRHFKAGLSFLKAEDFDAAAAELELSVKIFTNKNNLYNLANCYRALHRYGEALAFFERVLDEFPKKLGKEMRDDIQAQIKEINDLVARLTIEVNLDGASVELNDKPAGTSPLKAPLIVAPGEYTVTVSLDGHDTVSKALTLTSASEHTVAFELEVTRARLTITTDGPGAEITVNGESVGTTPLDAPVALLEGVYAVAVKKSGFKAIEQRIELAVGEEKALHFDLVPEGDGLAPSDDGATPSQEEKRRLSPVFWSGLAGTVAFAGASAALWAVTGKKVGEYNDTINRMESEWTMADFNVARELHGDIPKLNKVAIGMTAATGACLALMIGGLFIDTDDETPEPATATVSPTPGGVTVSF